MSMNENKHIITALVNNHSGLLTRMSGLFARRGYNIDSLAVSNTENERYSRMTIVARGDDAIVSQIIKQLQKLHDCVYAEDISENNAVLRELLLIKLTLESGKRPEIESTCAIYNAKIVDLSPESVIIELTGKPQKIDAFIEVVRGFGILELSRAGLTALQRGISKAQEDL